MRDNNGLIVRDNAGPPNMLPMEPYDFYPPPDMLGFQFARAKQLRDTIRRIMKRKWLILTCAVLAVAGAVVYTKRQTPVYQAVTKLEIEPESSNVLPYQGFQNNQAEMYYYEEYVQTQIKHITSRSLAQRVAVAAGLDKSEPSKPEEPKGGLAALWGWLRGSAPAVAPDRPLTREERTELGIDTVLGGLSVTPIKNSRIVEIGFSSTDPQLAARIVNILVDEYIEYNFQAKFDATARATDFLQKQLVDLKGKVEDSEAAMVEYARQHNILSVGEKQDVVMQTLADLNSKLTEAKTARMQKESVYRSVADATSDKFPQALRTPMIERLEEKLQADEQELARISSQLGPAMPQVKQIESQVKKAREQLQGEKQLAIEHARTEYRTGLAQEELLAEAFEQQKAVANELNESNIHYNILKREVDTTKQLYDGLLQRLKEAGVAAGLRSSNIRVVDQAQVPVSPISPNLNKNLMMAMLAGLGLGLGLALFLNYLDNTVKTPEDVEVMTGLPSLGLIPSLRSARRSYGYLPSSRKRRLQAEGLGEKGVELASLAASKSLIAESYRGLRTALLLSMPDDPPKVIMITSSGIREGKTTTVCNLGISLAQTGKKVLLLDCDMRRPRIGRIFEVNSLGLSEYLTGQVDFGKTVQESTIPNLSIVHAGTIPPNPGELLASARMGNALQAASQIFDFILIDTPPLMSVTDPLILAPMMDGVILVTRGAKNPPEVLNRAKKSLDMVHARVLGVVCNNVDFNASDSTGYRYRQYADYSSYISDDESQSGDAKSS